MKNFIKAFTRQNHQKKGTEDCVAAVRRGQSGVLVSPTGSGKSLTFSDFAAVLLNQGINGKSVPVLVTQPDETLIGQNFETLARNGLLKGKKVCFAFKDKSANPFKDNIKDIPEEYLPEFVTQDQATEADIVIATKRTIGIRHQAARSENHNAINDFCMNLSREGGVIIDDEAHLETGNSYFGRFLQYTVKNGGAKYIGFTATPYQADEAVDILETIGETMETGIVHVTEFDEVIATGMISPPEFYLARGEIMDNMTMEDRINLESLAEAVAKEQGISLKSENCLASELHKEVISRNTFKKLFDGKNPVMKLVGEKILEKSHQVWEREAADRNCAISYIDSIEGIHALSAFTSKKINPKTGQPYRVASIDSKSGPLI